MDDKLYITGKINKVTKSFFTVITNDKKHGLVHVSDITDYYVSNITKLFKVGEILELVVKYSKDNIYFCDFKYGRADFLNFPFKYEIVETPNKFNGLYEHNNNEVLKWKK